MWTTKLLFVRRYLVLIGCAVCGTGTAHLNRGELKVNMSRLFRSSISMMMDFLCNKSY